LRSQFGASDPLKGHVPVALLVLRDSIERTEEEVVAQVISEVREHIGSFACLKSVAMVPALPKTRSGKVMRATISAIAESRPFKVPATIENEAVLGDIRDALQKLGYAEKDSLIK
jgi:propionyl-CoA synthetase